MVREAKAGERKSAQVAKHLVLQWVTFRSTCPWGRRGVALDLLVADVRLLGIPEVAGPAGVQRPVPRRTGRAGLGSRSGRAPGEPHGLQRWPGPVCGNRSGDSR